VIIKVVQRGFHHLEYISKCCDLSGPSFGGHCKVSCCIIEVPEVRISWGPVAYSSDVSNGKKSQEEMSNHWVSSGVEPQHITKSVFQKSASNCFLFQNVKKLRADEAFMLYPGPECYSCYIT
jgi:hypothetical protein